MRWHKQFLIAGAVIVAVAVTTAAALGASTTRSAATHTHHARKSDDLQVGLTPSSGQLAACMPGAQLTAGVALTTDEHGFDRLGISGRNLPPNTEFTIFLLQQAGAPFGAAEYIGDFSTDAAGNAHNNLRLIVQEAFSSTLVNGVRTRVDLNRIGVWFADPAGDDFCLGANGGAVTPFDGDNEAGVQAFNSANAEPLPAP
ncbi:MAG: hypothetical protein ACJ77E_12520 [Gaiellaceae bacterium]